MITQEYLNETVDISYNLIIDPTTLIKILR